MSEKGKKRHGCLTAWLILMIVASLLGMSSYLFAADLVRQGVPGIPDWAFIVLPLLSALNIAFAIALFLWKRWGFWGFVVNSVIAFGINLMLGLGLGTALFGLIGMAVLYGVLQIGNENKGWPQLE